MPFNKKREVITKVLAINQNIGIIDFGTGGSGKYFSKTNRKEIIIIQLIVNTLNEVVITLIPIYCKNERYKPKTTNRGVVIIGIIIKSHQFGSIYFSGHISPILNENAIHKENIKINSSKNKVMSCLYILFKDSNLVFKSFFYFCYYSI